MTESATRASRPATGQLANTDRPRVIYVMGAGRSGSTILGVTLGNTENVFYAGELDAWLPRSGEPQVSGPERDRFWQQVRSDVEGAEELYGHASQRAIERSMALFRVREWPSRRRLRKPYRRTSERLYRAVARAAGTPVIVDTSHYPLRARELQRIDGIDLYLIYLMRDPQSVVASFNRKDVAQYSKATLTTNVYLWLTSALAVSTFWRQPADRRLFVRYERFLADPAGVTGEIVGLAGVKAPAPDFTSLRIGLPFQGNRLIHSEVIELDSTPPARRPARSRLTSLMQAPWLLVARWLRPAAGSDPSREASDADRS
ncbi:MAG TPA: sulfotransferase [Solirubrobacteraceae bacterium]|jgi:hypothetical protein